MKVYLNDASGTEEMVQKYYKHLRVLDPLQSRYQISAFMYKKGPPKSIAIISSSH